MQILIEAGSEIRSLDEDQRTALHIAAEQNRHFACRVKEKTDMDASHL